MLWRPEVSEPDEKVVVLPHETPHHPRQSTDPHLRVWASMTAGLR